jgi:hypothetical protein
MKRRHQFRGQHAFTLSWIDMVYAMLAAYAFLFIVAYAMIHPEEAKAGVEQKAEFLVMMSWPKTNLDDIDLHLQLPDEQIVNFDTRQRGYAMLDVDDMGMNLAYVAADGKTTLLHDHQEVIAVRAIVPGKYVANVHVYQIHDAFMTYVSDPVLPMPVHVKLIKLNPAVTNLAEVDFVKSRVGEQKTANSFKVDSDGTAKADTTADIPFIPEKDSK